jgi:glycerate 2-kinase
VKVLVCPDRFKGTFSAADVARHFSRGVRRALPSAKIVLLPMSDGGAGFLDALDAAGALRIVRRRVHGPLDTMVSARLGLTHDGRTAVVEAAEACGLSRVPESNRDPRRATTFGVGELVFHAATLGVDRMVIGLGGTATNDGGLGFARAIGARAFDGAGREATSLLDGPMRVDASGIDGALRELRFVVAGDVENPLCGPRGATHVFGPQKGVTPPLARKLDDAMGRWGRALEAESRRKIVDMPGAGAAGGLGAALVALLGARIVPGAEWVARHVGLAGAIRRASLVVTGEGRIDAQTLDGKTVLRVARVARAKRRPVLAIGGRLGPGALDLLEEGVTGVVGAARGDGMASGRDLAAAAEAIVRAWLAERDE